MDELVYAGVGASDLAYNALAAALETSARAAGLARESSDGSREVKVEVVQYDGGGTWLLVSCAGDTARELAKGLAVALAKTLRRKLQLHLVAARDGQPLERHRFQAEVSGRLAQGAPLDPAHENGGGDPLERAERALNGLLAMDARAVLHRQKRTYHQRSTTGNARLDRFLEAVEKAEKVELQPEADGRFCVRLLLPGGIRQSSYFNAAELERLRALGKV